LIARATAVQLYVFDISNKLRFLRPNSIRLLKLQEHGNELYGVIFCRTILATMFVIVDPGKVDVWRWCLHDVYRHGLLKPVQKINLWRTGS